jgi:hypothetical protein
MYTRAWARLIIEPTELLSFAMSQKMLRGIRDRAERTAAPIREGSGARNALKAIQPSNYKLVAKAANLQGFCALALGHWIGPLTVGRRLIGQHKRLFAGTYKDGSDGTRTRDLRRDRSRGCLAEP